MVSRSLFAECASSAGGRSESRRVIRRRNRTRTPMSQFRLLRRFRSKMNDPIVETIAQALLDYKNGKVESASQPYGPLSRGLSGLLLRLQSDLKKLNLADREMKFESMVSFSTQQP